MRFVYLIPITIFTLSITFFPGKAWSLKKKVAQSGMTYLAISPGARLSSMGDASVAAVSGIDAVFYNPAVLADLTGKAGCINQVNWLVETKLYTLAAAFSLKNWGALALDFVYMDYGRFTRTQPVDQAIDPRGFLILGDFSVDEFSTGLTYAYRISDRFAFGLKIKHVYEDLGMAPIVSIVKTDTVQLKKNWHLNHWGIDFGTIYHTGFKSLTFAMSLRNFSTDMKYWYEEFQLPLCLRMGLALDLMQAVLPENKDFTVNLAVDALHPSDYLERIHVGTELVYLKRYALRAGYQFNHDVETFSLGCGFQFQLGSVTTQLDYAYTNAQFFKDISRFSLQFIF